MSEWKSHRLGDFLTLEYGKPLDKGDRKDDGLYPAYGANGVKCRSDKFYCENETIIVGRKGSAGELTLTEERFWPLDVTYFVKFDQSKYDLTFIYYLLSQLDLPSLATGVKPGINRNNVYSIGVRTPSIPEQQRIVAILDQAFADIEKARANAEKNLKNARELFDSYLNQVFSQRGEGWASSQLKDITSKIGSGATPRGGNDSYKVEGTPLIRSMNVHDRRFVEKNIAFIDDEQADKLNNVIVEENDVLLNITGASVARCCVAHEDFLPARVNQHVSIIRVDKTIVSPQFLNFLLTSKFYKDQLLGIGEAGSTRQAITKAQIENFTVDYPVQVSAQIELLEGLLSLENQTLKVHKIYKNKLASLDELKKSLLQKAFSGELTKGEGRAA